MQDVEHGHDASLRRHRRLQLVQPKRRLAGAQAFPREGSVRCHSVWLSVDRVLATVMFTDIVGSTEKRQHSTVAGDICSKLTMLSCGAISPASADAGDGFLATFHAPRGVRRAAL